MSDAKDRRKVLLNSRDLNGIDFVEIANDTQTRLRVHFFNAVEINGVTPDAATISGGESIFDVPVNSIDVARDWSRDENHQVLTLTVPWPGDFSTYTLGLKAENLDSFFNRAEFSFKARCPSRLDCQPKGPRCPVEQTELPPIDYLAKDFLSFRQALLDFSALRYPEWQERSEADFGMMFLEALSAVGDELSYGQDRIAAEASIDTATQRRSVVRLARLVDYEPQPATSATVMLQFDVENGVNEVPYGLLVSAGAPDGGSIPFETGGSLKERVTFPSGVRRTEPETFLVSAAWNRGAINPYWFDDSQRCLEAGATSMFLMGREYKFQPGQLLLIETAGATIADPPIRQIVRLRAANYAIELCDPLFRSDVDGPGALAPFLTCPESPPGTDAPTAVTQIFWEETDKLLVNRDLTQTVLVGNLVPATQGLTIKVAGTTNFSDEYSERFVIPPASNISSTVAEAVVRSGPNDIPDSPSPQYLYTVRRGPLAWLRDADPERPASPEILLTGRPPDSENAIWPFLRRLIDAREFDNAFTLDAARFSAIARVGKSPATSQVQDYDGDGGDTLRFGDAVFGQMPVAGTQFDVLYRIGVGALGNVAADAITQSTGAFQGIIRATNPLPASGGTDAEPLDRVRRMAPQEFRAKQYRAVRREDYESAAETLAWIQRAGTVFRWTGSWLTVFTTPDPLQSEQVSVDQRIELLNLLNRYRMAGYESYVPDAIYVSLEVVVEICARPDAFRADVLESVLSALSGSPGGMKGFFDPDNFTFGQGLERSALEAAIQKAPGVAGVTCIKYRARGQMRALAEMPDIVSVGTNEIIRCDNDPSLPEHGSLKVIVRGGK
jgi:hypothetical protein